MVLLCASVWVPICFLPVNTLSSPETVARFPKSFRHWSDLRSLSFFADFAGMLTAIESSVIVAGLTMMTAIALGAPAG